MIDMRIEQRGSEWVVLPENGDKILGKHKTKEDALAQLRAIEASKTRAQEISFEASRGPDGLVRSGVWDRVCVPGHDEKDGESTDFNLDTLSQMADNFARRGDPIPIDYNHQSNYAKLNGQPAPALGFYGALAVVWGGEIAKVATSEGVTVSGTEPGLDLSKDGLWAYRCEVTEIGDQLLPNFKLLSPTFTPDGVDRDGTSVGYCLAAVAATNTPWQSGTSLTFSKETETTGIVPKQPTRGGRMSKLAAVARLLKMEEGADDAAVKSALAKKMDDEAMSAMEEETYAYDDEANKLEEMAKAYEDANMEEEGDDTPPHLVMRKMAAKFRKLGKMGDPPFGGKETPSEEAAEKKEEEKAKMEDESEAKMATMEASLRATQAKLEKLEKAEADRAKLIEREREIAFERLADQAVAGGYPKEARGALIKFARTDLDGARASVAHLLPKGAPEHLFDRVSRQGGPINGDTSSRVIAGPAKPRSVMAMGRRFIEDDGNFADEIKRVAESADPTVKAKVDKYLSESRREVKFDRLLAAERIVRAERPDLAEEGE